MSLKQKLLECIPDAYYSDGRKAKCMLFRICNMFDIDSQSFKEVKVKEYVDGKKEEETKVTFGKINHYISDNTKDD